jgi:serine/threonine protein kinase
MRQSALVSAQNLGRYTLLRKLAVGGMAEVFLARANGPGGFAKRLVVKRVLPHLVEDPRFVEMFLSEATLAAQLNHPNVVQIFDFGEIEGQYYLAMEYIDGPNLRVLAQRAREFQQPLSFQVCARIVSQAAEGLKYAHDLRDDSGQLLNLVHRDISPDNILVTRAGGVKVVDFGIAKTSHQIHHTKSGVIKGKMAYMPPEQLNRDALDLRADIYALGVVLYELVSGMFPFDATSEVSIIRALMNNEPLLPIEARVENIPKALANIITTCLSKPREGRFNDCSELQRALEKFIQGTQTTVVPGDIANAVNLYFPAQSETDLSQSGLAKQPTQEAFAPTFNKHSDVLDTEKSHATPSGNGAGSAVLAKPSKIQTPARSVWPLVMLGVIVAFLAAIGAVLLCGQKVVLRIGPQKFHWMPVLRWQLRNPSLMFRLV